MKKIYVILAFLFIGPAAIKSQNFNFNSAITSSLLIGGYTVQSTVTGTLPGASSYSWSASSASASCVATQTVLASSLPSGSVVSFGFPCCIDFSITCTAYNGSVVVGSPLTKVISCSFTTSMPEYGTNTIRVYPNPAHGYFIIEGSASDAEVIIYDLLGRSISPPVQRQGEVLRVNTGSLACGVYYVRVGEGQGASLHRLILD